ncbi:MAG TPA: hypothetical protein VLX44_09915 [Xanthobacteraceae bacterium]|nr:hypothetical protein [Xanthobacteraceae bacterium]
MAERSDLPSFSRGRENRARSPGTASFTAIFANRRNAQRSTGPRTPAGKAKAARNSRRHGLSVPVLADPALAREVEACAGRIAGEGASAARREIALHVAEAEIDLARIERVRQALSAALAAGRDVRQQLPRIERYARRARFRHEMALADLAAPPKASSTAGLANRTQAERTQAERSHAERSHAERSQSAEQTQAERTRAERSHLAERTQAAEQSPAESSRWTVQPVATSGRSRGAPIV